MLIKEEGNLVCFYRMALIFSIKQKKRLSGLKRLCSDKIGVKCADYPAERQSTFEIIIFALFHIQIKNLTFFPSSSLLFTLIPNGFSVVPSSPAGGFVCLALVNAIRE